jgi:hypothetical protein
MVGRRAVLAAILGAVLAACGAGVASSPPTVAPRTDAHDVAVTPSAASATAAITPVSQSPSGTPRPTLKPTPVPGPAKPSGVKFDEQVRVSDDENVAEFTQTVTWRTPRTEGIEIRVYGVTKCLAEPRDPPAGTSGPCLVEHAALPASVLTLLATASASDGVVSWRWTEETGCNIGLEYDPAGPAYYAVVLAAYSASRHSIFAIAEPGGWWRPAPDEIVC